MGWSSSSSCSSDSWIFLFSDSWVTLGASVSSVEWLISNGYNSRRGQLKDVKRLLLAEILTVALFTLLSLPIIRTWTWPSLQKLWGRSSTWTITTSPTDIWDFSEVSLEDVYGSLSALLDIHSSIASKVVKGVAEVFHSCCQLGWVNIKISISWGA